MQVNTTTKLDAFAQLYTARGSQGFGFVAKNFDMEDIVTNWADTL